MIRMNRLFILCVTLSLVIVLFAGCKANDASDSQNTSGGSGNGNTSASETEQQETEDELITFEQLRAKDPVPESDIFCAEDKNGNGVLEYYGGTETLVVLPEEYMGDRIVTVSKYTFANDSVAKGIIFPDTMTRIGDMSCGSSQNLQIVVLGANTKSIGDGAFFSCKKLHTVILNDGLESIGDMAFAFCDDLKSIEIPESVTNISVAAFFGQPDGFTIIGKEGSYAEQYVTENLYASEHGFKFVTK